MYTHTHESFAGISIFNYSGDIERPQFVIITTTREPGIFGSSVSCSPNNPTDLGFLAKQKYFDKDYFKKSCLASSSGVEGRTITLSPSFQSSGMATRLSTLS